MAKGTVAVRFTGDTAGLKRALDQSQDKLKGWAGKVGGILKTGLFAAGATGAAALTKGFLDSLDNERAVDQVAASFGLGPEESAELGRVAGQVYADAYGESLGQVADAAADVQRNIADLTGENVEGLTKNALNFAEAFDTDVTSAVASAGFLIKNGLVKDGQEAFDLLTAAFQKLPPAVRDELVDATQEYSTFFADLGIAGSDAFALMTEAAQKGGKFGVDKVGDALKELTIRSTDMSVTSTKAYETAGLSAERMSARFLQGGDEARGALDDLVDGLLSIKDPVDRSNAAISLFGTPLEDLSVSEIPEFLAQLDHMGEGMGDVEGAVNRMGGTLRDNLATRIEAFKRKGLQGLAQFVGRFAIPAVEELVGGFSAFVGAFKAGDGDITSSGFPGFMERLAAIARETFDKIAAKVREWWPKIRYAFEQVRDTVQRVWPRIQRIITDVATTIGEVISGVVDVVLTLWDNFGNNILSFVQRVWPNIQQTISGAMQAIQGVIQTITALIHGDWGKAWDGIKMLLSGVWNAIQGIIKGALEGVRLAVGAALEVVGSMFKSAWNGILDFFGGLPGKFSRAASGLFDGIKNAFRSAVNWIIRAWNGLEFKIPGFDPPGPGPKFGGFTLGVPNIPLLHSGGIFQAPGGAREGLALLESGEGVVSRRDMRRPVSAQPVVVNINNPVLMGTSETQVKRWIVGAINQARSQGIR